MTRHKEEAPASPAAATEIKAAAPDGIFALEEEQRTSPKVFLSGKDAFRV